MYSDTIIATVPIIITRLTRCFLFIHSNFPFYEKAHPIKGCAFGLSIQLLVYDGYIIVSIHQIILYIMFISQSSCNTNQSDYEVILLSLPSSILLHFLQETDHQEILFFFEVIIGNTFNLYLSS